MVTLCFKEKGTFIKCLVFLVSVLIMILVALAVILVNRKEENHVCKSKHCINLSAEVIRHGDKSINPCEDFYAFACASVNKNRKELPPPSPEEEIEAMIAAMVQTSDSKPFIMQKSFYLSCSNLGAIEMNDHETILDMFYSLGDWPVLRGGTWHGTHFDWTEVAKITRRLGFKFDWFLDFSVYRDVNDTGLNLLKIDVPPLTALRHSEINGRQDLFRKVAIILGAPEKLVHYETGTTINFETNLRTLMEEYQIRKDHLNVLSLPKTTINEVQSLWPNIIWLDLINNITGVPMSGNDYVIFDEVLDYVRDLNKLIYGTPKSIVANYMMWKIVEEYWPYFSRPIREEFENYYQKFYKVEPELNRQKFCLSESRKEFPLIAESEYIRKHVTDEKRQTAKDMFINIRKKIINLIEHATWINRDVRRKVVYKLENLNILVGGIRQVFDEFGFAEDLGLYGFVFKSTNVIEMLTQRKLRFYDNYFSVINRAITNRTVNFYEKVLNITRFTIINGNTLVIPAAVLRDALYNPKLPNYFNYATLGTALAHQIFDYLFPRNNETIFENQIESEWKSDPFDSVVKCLIRDSSYLHNPELRKPKKMRELLANFAAPEVAYESYKDWALMNPQEDKLPALEFTPRQLFWIHTSQLFCNKIYSRHNRVLKIIGPLRNSRNFADDYNCTETTRMYSRKPCKIL